MIMDTVTLIVLINMTGALVVAGIAAYLLRSGKWPKKSRSDKK